MTKLPAVRGMLLSLVASIVSSPSGASTTRQGRPRSLWAGAIEGPGGEAVASRREVRGSAIYCR